MGSHRDSSLRRVTAASQPELSISIVIPCRNDDGALTESLRGIIEGLTPDDEILIADASDDDRAAAVAATFHVRFVRCLVAGRGSQMNAGARAAKGHILIFSHADTRLTAAHLRSIREFFTAHPDAEAGAFHKDTRHHYPAVAWMEPLVRSWMSRFGIVYGDQSVFLRRARFDAIGGFPELPLMEDVAMSRSLRQSAGFRLLDPPLRTSMRAFARRGRFLTRLRNILFVLLFRCGVSAGTLYRWYYGRPAPDSLTNPQK